MSLRNWFASKRKLQNNLPLNPSSKADDSAHEQLPLNEELKRLWTECVKCNTRLLKTTLRENTMVCPECNYHFRIGASDRIAHLTDSFTPLDEALRPADPLHFTDTQPYQERFKEAEEKTRLAEAVITGIATVDSQSFALAVMDFSYLGGSMGSVVGEKITRLIEIALDKQLSLVIVSSSGGARMQEGTFSLMQMVKTGAALARYHEAGLLYISVLSEPTYGGVTASYGTLGDIIIAEEGARIGFAGRRVIEQTIRQKLPPDFQTAGYLLKYGQIDMVVHRHALKDALARLIGLHEKSLALAGPAHQRQCP